MANVEVATTITIKSDVLGNKQLEEKRQKVKKWQDYGYNIMAILYFLSQEVCSVSTTFVENGYIINLG